MDKKREFYYLQQRLGKIESWERVNRLLLLGCLITTFHSLSYINTDKKLNMIHYLGFAGGTASFVCASKLQIQKQKYQDRWSQLQRED